MTEQTITGSCNCGRHKFTIPKPSKMNICHCTDCRRWTGSMHSDHLMTDVKTIDSHGSPEPRVHTKKSDSGNTIQRAWCDECGCGLWIRPGGAEEKTYLKAGLFKPGEIPNPTSEVYLKNMEKWETPAKGTETTSQEM